MQLNFNRLSLLKCRLSMLATFLFVLILTCIFLQGHARAQTAIVPQDEESAAAALEMDQAIQRVADIVNQPITHYPRQPWAKVFSPGWFHEKVMTPDFNTIDIRMTQEFPYPNGAYVTSNLNPTEMFAGSELEFNSMTKYFYADRTLPKKRLTETEMLEINRLYRIIGSCEHVLASKRPVGGSGTGVSHQLIFKLATMGAFIAIAAFLILGKRKAV